MRNSAMEMKCKMEVIKLTNCSLHKASRHCETIAC